MHSMSVHRGDGGLRVRLQLLRAQQAGDPHAFRFEPQDYILPTPGGGSPSARFPWTEEVLADLSALRQPGRDPAVLQRLGEQLRRFVLPAGWAAYEEKIALAVAEQRPIFLTLCSSAAELYALPWELLTLGSGQFVGEVDGLLLRFEWPESSSRGEQPSPRPEGGRILLAWSAAGGAVPAAEHVQAIASACAAGFHPFDTEHDVLAQASLPGLVRKLEDAQRTGAPIAVLHLLCHGAAVGSSSGLVLDGDGGAVVVDAVLLRQQLAPFAAMLRLVVLSACDAGHGGVLGNHLGSLAQALHRLGIAAVIASRAPLSVAGAMAFSESFYRELLSQPAALETAFLAARRHLLRRESSLPAQQRPLDWASLQLYARQEDGDDTRPLIFRPYRGLLAFEPQHQRFFFGREDELNEICRDLHALIAAGRPRLLIVAGASGTGKSSLVLASAVPRLLQEPGSAWLLVRLRPGSAPQQALKSALLPVSAEGAASRRSLLIVVDQLEEIFTHGAPLAERQAFLRQLWELSADPQTGTSVIVTLRVDFIGQCGELSLDEAGLRFDRVAYDEAHRVFIAQLGQKQLRTAIEEPARRVGLQLEEGLVSRILQDVGSEPGALPVLEYTLDLLWQGRKGTLLTQAAYDAAGGVGGALHQRADRLIDGLDAAEQRVARRLLLRLVSVGENEAPSTRRRVPLSKLRQAAPDDAARCERALSLLVDARLLVRDQAKHDPEVMIEVAHEALIRKWPRLAEWVRADHQRLRELEKIETWVSQWRDQKLGTLLTGNQIGYVAELQKDLREDFPKDAQALLTASQAQQTRQRRVRQLMLLALCTAAVLATGFGFRARKAQQQTQARLVQLYEEQGLQALRQGEELRALVYLSQAYSESPRPSVALRTALGAAVPAAEAQQLTLTGHRDWLHGAAFSADGTRVVTASADKTAKVWDAHSGQELFTLHGHQDEVASAAFSGDGTRLLTASRDRTAKIWDAQTGRELRSLVGHQKEIWCAEFSPDGRKVLTASSDRTARIWDAHSGQMLLTLEGHQKLVRCAAFSADGTRVVTTSRDQTAKIWDAQSGKELKTLKGHRDDVHRAAFSLDGTRVLTASFDKTAKLWDAQTGEELLTFRGHARAVFGVALSPDGTRALTSSWDGTAKIWDTGSGRELMTLQGHRDGVFGALFSADGSRVVTASMDGTAKIWDVLSRRELLTLRGHTDDVMSLSFSADGSRLLSASFDGTARIWSTRSGKELQVLRGHSAGVARAVFNRDGSQVASSDIEGVVKVWAAASGQESLSFRGHAEQVWSLAFSPDGTRIATASEDSSARIWDARSGKELRVLSGHKSAVYDVAFSPDGARVVTGSRDNSATIWDAQSGRALSELLGHQDDILGVAFSPDGSQVVTAGKDKTVKVWDAQTGRLLLTLRGHQDGVHSARFAADGARLVTASRDATAKLWDVKGEREILTLQGHQSVLRSADFSRDGELVATASADLSIKLWSVSQEVRSPAQIAALVRCRAIFRLAAEGRLQESAPQLADCPAAARAASPAQQLSRIENLSKSGWGALTAPNLGLAQLYGQGALTLSQQGGFQDEEAAARRLLAEVARQRADLSLAQSQLGLALSLSRASHSAAGEALALLQLAVLKHEDLHDSLAALADLDRARALQPVDADVLINRAELLLSTGQLDAFFRDLPQTLKAQPDAARAVVLSAYAWIAALFAGSPDIGARAQALQAAYPAWPQTAKPDWVFRGFRHAVMRMQRPRPEQERVLAVIDLLEQPRSQQTQAQLASLLLPPPRGRKEVVKLINK